MPFGLRNDPATFQMIMDTIFRDLIGVYVAVYIDDIIIYSDNEDDHYQHIQEVLSRLQRHNLFAKAEKSLFYASEITFLGYKISTQGIHMDQEKISAIEQWTIPSTVKQVRQFLGLANFYRRFIRNFAITAQPLTNLTKKNETFTWNQEQEIAFKTIKDAFSDNDH
jgi:hypothetical protein